MIAAHEFYDTEYAQFWIADAILFFKFKPNLTLDLQVAKQVVADRIAAQEERIFPILCDFRGVISFEKSARDYLAHSGSLLASAVAFLVNEKITYVMSNFYLKVNKPTIPTEIFTNELDALTFLREFR